MKRFSVFAAIVSLCISLTQPPAHAAEQIFQAGGCHAKVSATLQIKDGNSWKDVIAAQGWESVASCPATNPYQPWAMADVAIGSTIRWHIYAPGSWDFYTGESAVQEVFDPNSIAPVTAQADIKSSDYPYVAALARASILVDQPAVPSSQKVTYLFENGVPIENQNMIKEGAVNFISHFDNILNSSGTPIVIIAYKTLTGGIALAKALDPSDDAFQADMERTFSKQRDPEKEPTIGLGGFSIGRKRLVVIGAPYFKPFDPTIPTYPQDPVVTTHELAHEVQATINRGINMRYPVWLCEGGAQVIGAAMSVYQGKDYWFDGRDQWRERIPANRTIADLEFMEGEDRKLSEYTTGAALSEYLIAWGGFSNSLLVNQISYKLHNPDTMAGFRQAFKIVYGQSLDAFYIHALPYVNYTSANWKLSDAISPEALAFITDRLGATKAETFKAEAAATDAANAKVDAANKAAELKAQAELKAIQEIQLKAALDFIAKQEAEAKTAAELKAKLEKAAATKESIITCVKGKLIKKVTAVNPVCPQGYKKK